MNRGLLSSVARQTWLTWYPRLLVAGSGALTQPIVDGTPLRNIGRYCWIDPHTIAAELHMSHSYFSPQGTGSAYVIELPVPAKRWGGNHLDASPQLIGDGYGLVALQNPAPQIGVVAALADPSWFNTVGEADKYCQAYIPGTLTYGTGTWTSGTSSVTIAHGLPYAPDATDINFVFTSAQTGTNFNWPGYISGIDATNFTMNVFGASIGSANVTYAWKIRAEPKSGTAGSWLYNPLGPWAWTTLRGFFLHLMYEVAT